MIDFANCKYYFLRIQNKYPTNWTKNQNNRNGTNKQILGRADRTFELAIIVKLLICYRFSFDNGHDFDRNRSAEINTSKK